MARDLREAIADWLMVAGSVLLAISLFLPWSHQVSRGLSKALAGTGALAGVPRDPTAWQVYSVADVLLALLAAAIFALALAGPRRPRAIALAGAAAAIAFVIQAMATPPTNGVFIGSVAEGVAAPANRPGSGAGETLALLALIVCAGGLALSLGSDERL